MADFQVFSMERMMSLFEQTVEYNLSESGVKPVPLGELIQHRPEIIDELLDTELNYPYANGNPELRENIAALYDGATAENVLVTIGAAEANYIVTNTLLAPGDEIAVMLPNYMQIWGVAKNLGAVVREFHLKEESGWALDVEELKEAVTPKTKLIAVCNPDNPTGHILTESEMNAVVEAADRVGAWILADEVYAGAERTREDQTPSFYGRYERVVAVGSLSKAYGLPGLRTGWLVAPPDTVQEAWKRHEYIAISATMLSNKLAAIALSKEVRPRLIDRTRKFVREGYAILEEWLKSHGDTFKVVPPEASAICFVRYNLDVNSTEFVERLRKEKSVFIVPGDHFGMDSFFRISFGQPEDYLVPALNRIHEFILELQR